jgi:hypothetical protein
LQLPTRVLAQALLGLADLAGSVPAAVDATALALGAAAAVVALLTVAACRKHRRMLRQRALVVPPR